MCEVRELKKEMKEVRSGESEGGSGWLLSMGRRLGLVESTC